MNFEQKVNVIKSTFSALATTLNENKATRMPLDVQDIIKDGKVVGVRLLSAIEPTSQFLYAPIQDQDLVAAFVFPADDCAVSNQLTLEVANAVRSAIADLPTYVVNVIAPKYVESGVSFTHNGEEVYKIYREFITNRAKLIAEEDQKVSDSLAV